MEDISVGNTVETYLNQDVPNDVASYPRRMNIAALPLWISQILCHVVCKHYSDITELFS